MLKKILGAILATSMLFSTNVLAEEFSTQPMISSGSTWNLALKSDGTVWAWGLNEYGLMATGTVNYYSRPMQIKQLKNIVQVDSKSGRGLALDNNGKVWIWGGGSGGKELKISESQLKSNTVARFTTREATPKMINDISDVKEINCSGGRAIAVKNDGTVWTWLNEEIDKNKENKVLPIQVKELSDVKSADIIGVYDEDSYAAIALKNDGTVWDWGNSKSSYIQRKYIEKESAPQQISALKDVTKISIGNGVFLALDKDGRVWSWGNNCLGKLGRDKAPYLMPQKVDDLGKMIDIKAGYRHCLALNSDGKVYGWGNNTNGELGKDGMYGRMVKVYKNDYAMFFYSEKPIVIPNVNNATFIETGREFSMFITKDGNILSCGKNGCNQLGRTRTTNIVGNVENKDNTLFNLGKIE